MYKAKGTSLYGHWFYCRGSACRSRANTYRILHTINVSDSDDMYG